MSKQRRLTAARSMRNHFRSSFRATARSHGQLRSLSSCCSCMCVPVSVRGLTCKRGLSESKRPPVSQRPIVMCSLACVCFCVVTLNFGGSVLPLSPSRAVWFGLRSLTSRDSRLSSLSLSPATGSRRSSSSCKPSITGKELRWNITSACMETSAHEAFFHWVGESL